MPPVAKRRLSNGAVRREAKRKRDKNVKSMMISSIQMDTRQTLQQCYSRHVMAASMSMFFSSYLIVIRELVDLPGMREAVRPVLELLIRQVSFFVVNVKQWVSLDAALFDIPLLEWLKKRQPSCRRHLRLATLRSDQEALKWTNFNIHQLTRLYEQFGLREYCETRNIEHIRVSTGHFHKGSECFYNHNPEELFLYSMARLASGLTQEHIIDNFIGGHYSRWSSGYRWFILYLNERYENILDNQGIMRFLPDFPRFRDAIEQYVQRDRWYVDHDGNHTWVPGLEKLPYNICMFIDDTIDRVRVPYSGPAGDFIGAPRRQEYMDAQESIFTGYKKIHGLKTQTVFFPNGMSTVYGPVSARQGDRGTLNLSNLDRFLSAIQAHLPAAMRCKCFGDSIFRGALEFIVTYYRALLPFVLSVSEKRCNAAFRAARMPIERNYGLKTCVFRICDSNSGWKLGKKCPYALEQMRVCHLLLNCYICLNGDQASSNNTFACTPPRLQDYLRL